MNELFSPQQLTELMDRFYAWVMSEVLIVGNAIQLAIAIFAFGAAVVIGRRLTRWLEPYRAKEGYAKVLRVVIPLVLPITWLIIQWLCISAANTMEWPNHLLVIIASLLAAWIAIRLVSQFAKNPVWSTAITWTAWSIAALNILGLLGPTIAVLDSAAINIGELRISLLTVTQSTLALAILLSLAVYLAKLIESRIRTSTALSPSVQVLFAKSLKIVLVGLAILIAIRSVGIDLTALAVFGGAIGLGVGFGLQKIISNLISGVILLVDKSIKPGDVIVVSGTYGWVTALGGRYVSVVTRDGVEHLIPNETLISERVENWTHSNSRTRLKIDVGVHYDSDLKRVIELCVEAAQETQRVLDDPAPRCLLIGFGDSSVDLQIRFWIADAHNGVQNVKSAVLLRVWEKFKSAGIEIPYPQRDLHLRSGAELISHINAAQTAA
jgi:small-conductance mechanosensitive channel